MELIKGEVVHRCQVCGASGAMPMSLKGLSRRKGDPPEPVYRCEDHPTQKYLDRVAREVKHEEGCIKCSRRKSHRKGSRVA